MLSPLSRLVRAQLERLRGDGDSGFQPVLIATNLAAWYFNQIELFGGLNLDPFDAQNWEMIVGAIDRATGRDADEDISDDLADPGLSDFKRAIFSALQSYEGSKGRIDCARDLWGVANSRAWDEIKPSKAAQLAELLNALSGDPIEPGTRIYVSGSFSYPIAFELAARGEHVSNDLHGWGVAPYLSRTLAFVAGLPMDFENSGGALLDPRRISKGALEVFDRVVALPPFNFRMPDELFENDAYARFPVRFFSSELAGAADALAHCSGQAIVMVAGGALTRTAGGDRDFKASLVRDGRLSAVIRLPNAIWETSSFYPSLLVLRANRGPQRPVRFIDGSANRYEPNRRGASLIWDAKGLSKLLQDIRQEADRDEVVRVGFDEIEANAFNLDVSRYVAAAPIARARRALEGAHTLSLSEIAEIIRPQALGVSDEADEGVVALEATPADIGMDGMVGRPTREITVDFHAEHRLSKQLIEAGDILLTAKGNIGRIGLVADATLDDVPVTASQAFIIIRMRRRANVLSSVTLYRYLQSELGQTLLNGLASAGTVASISMSDLKSLPILVPDAVEASEAENFLKQQIRTARQVEQLMRELDELGRSSWPHYYLAEVDGNPFG